MQMKHGLSAVASLVDHQPVAIVGNTDLAGHLRRDSDKMADDRLIRSIHIQRPGNVLARDHQNVDGRVRHDIMKGDG